MKIDAQQLIDLLRAQTGPRNGLRVTDLAQRLTGQSNQATWRNIRSVIKGLRMQGLPICGHPSKGYYWAESAADLEATIAFLRERAMSSLAQIAKLRRVAIPLMEGQMELSIGPFLIIPPIQPDYSQAVRERYVVTLPSPLLLDLQQFCEANPDWGVEQLVEAALMLFLNGQEAMNAKNR
jgi:hypothetical protein